MSSILIIEDDTAIRQLIQKLLSAQGYEVLTAENGIEGLKMVQHHLPDLVICDVMMPDMNGYEVLTQIREQPTTATLPFIFLSGQDSPANLRQGMNLGADDYLTKPVNVEELLKTITVRLEKQTLVEQSSQEKLETLRRNLASAFPHELRTPLQNILLATDILDNIANSNSINSEELLEIVDIFKESSQRLLELSQKFLLYSSLEAKALAFADQSFTPTAILRQIVPIITEIAQQKGKTYQRLEDLQLSLTEAQLKIQPDCFRILLQEVIDNSLKFSSLETPIQIEGMAQDSFYQISITNQGRGFSPENLKKLGAYMQFERNKYEQQGSGLGLAIVRKILEINQGKLEIKSIPNQTTTVILKIPLA